MRRCGRRAICASSSDGYACGGGVSSAPMNGASGLAPRSRIATARRARQQRRVARQEVLRNAWRHERIADVSVTVSCFPDATVPHGRRSRRQMRCGTAQIRIGAERTSAKQQLISGNVAAEDDLERGPAARQIAGKTAPRTRRPPCFPKADRAAYWSRKGRAHDGNIRSRRHMVLQITADAAQRSCHCYSMSREYVD